VVVPVEEGVATPFSLTVAVFVVVAPSMTGRVETSLTSVGWPVVSCSTRTALVASTVEGIEDSVRVAREEKDSPTDESLSILLFQEPISTPAVETGVGKETVVACAYV